MFLAELLSTNGRQDGYGGPRISGNGRPVGQYGVRDSRHNLLVAVGDFVIFLECLELNLLDAKLIGLGYVRGDLVRELCARSTQALIREEIQR